MENLLADSVLPWLVLVSVIILVLYGTVKYSSSKNAKTSVSEDRNHQNGIDELEKEFQDSIASFPDAVMVLRYNFEIEWGNETASEWFQVDFPQHHNVPITQLLEDQGLVDYMHQRNFSDSYDSPAPGVPDMSLRIHIVPYRNGLYLMQARDVTQIKQLEQIRRDFVSNASHELRTPISVLYGYLDMMKEEEKTIDKQWHPAIDRMYEQTERIKKIVDDMMILSRLEETDSMEEHQYMEIADILESACSVAKVLSGDKKHAFETDIEPNFSLHGNSKEIESLVANLLSNAVRYTPPNGTITLSWQVDLTGGTLSVIDTGIGIEQKDIPRLTERFYRTDPARSRETGGTGLGLAIVNHIVNRHQAQFIIQSKIKKGSQFSVHFPLDRIKKNHDQVDLLLN